jgi:hypothetical protein
MVTEIKLPNCFKSSLRLKLTECAKAITFLLINDRVLMVYIGTGCIVHIFLYIFQCMVILVLVYR